MFSSTLIEFHQTEILVNEGNQQFPAEAGSLPAVGEELTAVGSIDAGQDLDERGLARAVFAEKRVDLSGVEVDVDVVERERAAKPLREATYREKRRGRTIA